MKILQIATVVMFLLGTASGSQAAGFDCGKATTEDEKLICADPTLSALDGEMTENYARMLDKLSKAEQISFRKDQLAWLKNEHLFCDRHILVELGSRKKCLADDYSHRIDFLKLIDKDEDLIRADPALSAVAEEMSEKYIRALASLPQTEQSDFGDDQIWWLKRLHNSCANLVPTAVARTDCFRIGYIKRTATLKNPRESSIVHLNNTYSCPEDDHVVVYPINWTNRPVVEPPGVPAVERAAVIDIQEWGGKRPVSIRTISTGRDSLENYIIGEVGSPTTSDDTQPWDVLARTPYYLKDGDVYDFLLTDKGAYFVADKVLSEGSADQLPQGKTYLRLTQGGLVPVCVAAKPLVPR